MALSTACAISADVPCICTGLRSTTYLDQLRLVLDGIRSINYNAQAVTALLNLLLVKTCDGVFLP